MIALIPSDVLVTQARSSAELDGEMALRFDVYCREKGWLDPMGFLDRRETDVDDAWAHRSGARLVLCAAPAVDRLAADRAEARLRDRQLFRRVFGCC